MQHTKIEWVKNEDGTQGYTINPIKGLCPVDCKDNQGKSYCYAGKMYDRFKWNPEVRFEPSVFNTLPKKPCRVFIGSTMELFLFDDWMKFILNRCQDFPNHTFQFLTKQPQNLSKFSPFPENCWVGVTATDYYSMFRALNGLAYLDGGIQAKIKFISFEPLLESVKGPRLNLSGVNWVVIGSQTKPYKPPLKIWVDEIIEACKKVDIPYFLKNNLRPLLGDNLVQNMPKGVAVDH